MVIDEELDAVVVTRLRAVEQRYTSGRRKLVSALREGDGPLTIPQILEHDTSLAQSSVYRNLALLEEVDVVTRIVTHDEFARYELAEAFTEHHHHLICTSCGDVADFSLRPGTESDLETALDSIARLASFTVEGHRLDLIGRCTDCE